jgi:hypothetical protein
MENPLDKYNLQKYGVAGSSRTRGQEGAFQNGNAARDARRAARRNQQPATFAQMQEEGIARPAPAAMSSGPQMVAGQPASSMSASNTEYNSGPYNPYTNPTGSLPDFGRIPGLGGVGYNEPGSSPIPSPEGGGGAPSGGSGYDQLRRNALAELEAAFTGRKAALNEDLARRGIYASSGELGAGARLGDLEGQYARARAGLEADLLQGERGNEAQLISLLMQLLPLFQTGSRR